jgi:hypothetical protein
MSPISKALLFALLASAAVAAVAYSLQPRHIVIITLAPD